MLDLVLRGEAGAAQHFGLCLLLWRLSRLVAGWRRAQAGRGEGEVEGRGRLAVVTGAASGIGAATASLFERRGWRVLALDVNEEGLQQLYAGKSSHVQSLVVDLSDSEATEAVCDRIHLECQPSPQEAAQEWMDEGLSVLVNCAGLIVPLPVAGAPWADLERQMRVNVMAPVQLSRSLIPLLLRGNGGSIVNVSSVAALIGWPYQGLYSCSKAALEAFSSSLRREVVSNDLPLRVSCVQPGPVRSPFALGITQKLQQWASSNHSNPFAAGALASSSFKLDIEHRFSLTLNNPMITVSCDDVAEVIYCNAVAESQPTPMNSIMTPFFNILCLFLISSPTTISDNIAGRYL